MSMRRDHPDLWVGIVRVAREIVGLEWTEDQIAAVMRKVQAPSPDLLMDHIGHVLCWCDAAQASCNEEAIATVEMWQMPNMPVRITVGEDGSVSHALNVEAQP